MRLVTRAENLLADMEPGSFVWAVTSATINTFPLPGRAAIEPRAARGMPR